MKRIALALVALLTLGAPALMAEKAMPRDETVWDRIGPNDIQVNGHVMAVHDETFELRTLEEGLLTFPIPDQEGVMADLEMGNRIQVWYDPSFATDELDGRVTVWESYVIAIPENEPEVTIETEPELEQEAEEMIAETEETAEAVAAEIESETEEMVNETEEAAEELATETEEAFDNDDQDYYYSELPQTASSTPAGAFAGLLLIGAGALALRTRS